MLNGTTGAAAVCCEYSPGRRGAGYRAGGGNVGAGLRGAAGVTIGADGKPLGILQILENALNQAIHGGDSGASASGRAGAAGAGGPIGGQEFDFPMANPYQPVGDAKVPASPQFAWPGAKLRLVRPVSQPSQAGKPGRRVFNAGGNEDAGPPADKETGSESLGFTFTDSMGVALPNSLVESGGSSKLQTIIQGIATTLPATIQAIRANPSNIYPGTTYGPYATNAGGSYPGRYGAGAGTDIGASTGAAVGNIGDTLGGIVARHPYLVLGGVAAAVLLFMNPPRRR